MFVYIDEAGNTGKNNADEKQKWFYHMALASKYNLDFDTSLNEIKKKHSIGELHGVENPGLIESISPSLLKLLRKNCVDFCITVIEKSFLAYSKLYDTLFDNIENIGARAQFYQLRSLRLMLLCDLIQVLPENVAQKFYMECLLSNDEEKSSNVLSDVCDEILSVIPKLKDERAKEVIRDCIRWAKNHSSDIAHFSIRKIDRWRHLPHIVSFFPVISMMSVYARKHNARISKIIHDEQEQFKKIFKEMHGIASDVKTLDEWDLMENGRFDFRNIKESTFEMKNSKQSLGLQITDICLYIYTHRNYVCENKESIPNTFALLDYINTRTEPFIFTTNGCMAEAMFYYDKNMNSPFSETEINRGMQICAEWEKLYKEKLQNE